MSPDQAETIALKALGWLAANDELLPVFLGASGASTDELAARASDPAFLGAILEFLTMNDEWVMEFCDGAGMKYEDPLRARYALPGAEQMNWT